MEPITLNEVEQRLAKFLGQKRFEFNRDTGCVAQVYGGRDPLQAEIHWCGGELGFCKMHNLYPDLDCNSHPEWDAILYGYKIDIKSTERENGRLLVKQKKWRVIPDYFALMIGVFPTYRFAGFMASGLMLVEARLDKNLHYPAYAALQSELIPSLENI